MYEAPFFLNSRVFVSCTRPPLSCLYIVPTIDDPLRDSWYRAAYRAFPFLNISIHPASTNWLSLFLFSCSTLLNSSNFFTVKYGSEYRKSSMSMSPLVRLCFTLL